MSFRVRIQLAAEYPLTCSHSHLNKGMFSIVSLPGQAELHKADVGWNLITSRRRTPTDATEINLLPFIKDAVERGDIKPQWFILGREAGLKGNYVMIKCN